MNMERIAMDRCDKLLKMAAEIFGEDAALSRRYVSLARKIAMRHRIPLGSKRFCKKCNTIYIAGKTLKVRISPSQNATLYVCQTCGSIKKFPYIRERKARKKK